MRYNNSPGDNIVKFLFKYSFPVKFFIKRELLSSARARLTNTIFS